jgi:hypothetical protein
VVPEIAGLINHHGDGESIFIKRAEVPQRLRSGTSGHRL